MERIYYPYPANDGKHKYFIISKSGKKIKFGQNGASDFTIHKDEARRQRYINRHKKMSLNFGINQELIPLHSGLDFCSGKNQLLKKVILTLKNVSIFNIIF
jgi:hypothetical protein